MKVAVVTPTIGSCELKECLESVKNQTYKNITHYIIFDGKEHFDSIQKTIDGYSNVKTILLEENIGKGWLGHRAYAACSFLVNADIIVYLDQDNWFDPCHVGKLVEKIEQGNDWAYSLRKIYDKDGEYICEDNCESLGKWPVFFNDEVFHIDTSSFGIRRDIAIRIGHAWIDSLRPKAADRQFFQALKTNFPKFACTNAYTLNYRLGGNENSVSKEFFKQGNSANDAKYGSNFPWRKNTLVNIGPGISIIE
jgi:glycosyltransferase involved in cell wall biosynthesis